MMLAPVIDPTVLLVRALRISARAAGAVAFVVASEECPWASATFTGTRHRLDLAVEPGRAGDAWIDGLASLDLRMRGFFVADLEVERRAASVRLDVLTVASA